MWREAARYEPRMGEDEREALRRALARGGRALARLGPRATRNPGPGERVGTGGAGSAGSAVMADIKPQVYKDPRPAEYFTRFHEYVAHASRPGGSTRRCG